MIMTTAIPHAINPHGRIGIDTSLASIAPFYPPRIKKPPAKRYQATIHVWEIEELVALID
jgi:hypothetical protein